MLNVPPIQPNFKGDSDRLGRTKPTHQPRQNFKEDIRENRTSKNEQREHAVHDDDETDPPSLFDLQKKNKIKSKQPKTSLPSQQSSISKKEGNASTTKNVSQQPLEENGLATTDDAFSPDSSQEMLSEPPPLPGEIKDPNLVNRQAAILQQSQKSQSSLEQSTLETTKGGQISKKDKSKAESRSQVMGQEKANATLAGIHSSIQATAFQTEKSQENVDLSRSATIKELATQIIDRIQIMRKDNQTETMVTLRHPPILEGATLTLVTSDNAKREFNISFANLSPDAKLFLDRKLNEDSLSATLERKGIIVHMLTTTTQAENLLTSDSSQAARDQQDQQQQQEEQRQRRQKFEEEEET